MVSQPLFSLGRATRNYGQDVDEFKPERWISGGGDDGAAADGDKPKAELPDPLPFCELPALVAEGAVEDVLLRLAQHGCLAGNVLVNTPTAVFARALNQFLLLPRHCSFPLLPSRLAAVGPRDCVGRALAMLELQAVLATLVGRFSFALPPGVEGEGVAVLEAMVCYHITLHARNGMPLLVTPREA
jgi:cytochrome P450